MLLGQVVHNELREVQVPSLNSSSCGCAIGGLRPSPVVVVASVVTSAKETRVQGEQVEQLEERQDDHEGFKCFLQSKAI